MDKKANGNVLDSTKDHISGVDTLDVSDQIVKVNPDFWKKLLTLPLRQIVFSDCKKPLWGIISESSERALLIQSADNPRSDLEKITQAQVRIEEIDVNHNGEIRTYLVLCPTRPFDKMPKQETSLFLHCVYTQDNWGGDLVVFSPEHEVLYDNLNINELEAVILGKTNTEIVLSYIGDTKKPQLSFIIDPQTNLLTWKALPVVVEFVKWRKDPAVKFWIYFKYYAKAVFGVLDRVINKCFGWLPRLV